VNKELKERQKVITKLPQEEKTRELINQIVKIEKRLRNLQNVNCEYQENRKNLKKGQQYILRLNQEMKSKLEEYKAKLRELNRCPVCFSRIEDEMIEEIIKNYELGGVR